MPKTKEKRTEVLTTRVTPTQKRTFELAATKKGFPNTSALLFHFVIGVCNEYKKEESNE